MGFELAGGAVRYSTAEALDAVHEYAFATVRLAPQARHAGAFAPHDVPRYAYRTYDCVPASSGAGFSDLDLLVGAGRDAPAGADMLARLRSFGDRAAVALDRAHRLRPDFVDLTRAELGDDPPAGSAGRYLMDAWVQGMATPGLDTAVVHQTLHHKRPRLVPVLDARTIVPIRLAAAANRATVWQQIHDEIRAHASRLQDLADGFDKMATGIGDVSLAWPRLYDILVWMAVTRG